MRVINPSYKIMRFDPDALEQIEECARTCYKSEGLIGPGSASRLVLKLRENGHFPMFDHVSARVKFVCNRGVSHELVRHRVGTAFAQESTRYCNYSGERFGGEVTFIRPFWLTEGTSRYTRWVDFIGMCETTYLADLADGGTPDESRGYLVNDVKTEIVVTATFTAWRHFFTMRARNRKAHKQMRELMVPLLGEFVARCPEVFGDLAIGPE